MPQDQHLGYWQPASPGFLGSSWLDTSGITFNHGDGLTDQDADYTVIVGQVEIVESHLSGK